jgi:hypothetical protein
MRCYGNDLAGLEDFDGGLRSRLFQKNDTSVPAGFLRGMEDDAMYLWDDTYGCRYCFFRPDESYGDVARYCVIGPWLRNQINDETIDKTLKAGRIPYHLRTELVHYLRTVPQFAWESLLFDWVSFLQKEERYVHMVFLDRSLDSSAEIYNPEPDESLTRRIIKERYETEDAVLAAVSGGDADKALHIIGNLRSAATDKWVENDLRNWKNYLINVSSMGKH